MTNERLVAKMQPPTQTHFFQVHVTEQSITILHINDVRNQSNAF